MSSSRLTRPRRTRMYDCNYNLSERYYKPMVDHLDRKYSTAPSLDISDIPRHYSPLADGRSRRGDKSPDSRRPLDDEFDRPARIPERARTELETADDDMAAAMKRIQASRAARAALEEEISEISNLRSTRKATGFDYSEKLLDSVGLKSGGEVEKLRASLDDEPFFKRRVVKMTLDDDDEGAMTKWTSMKGRNDDLVEVEGGPTALMRARQSRNRLADLDAEMEQVADRSAARERRNNHLRALVQENRDNSESSSSSVRVKKTTIKSEKKTVTF